MVHSVTSVQQSAEPHWIRHQMHNRYIIRNTRERAHMLAHLQTHSTHMRAIPRKCHIAFKSKMGSLGLTAISCQEYAHATQFNTVALFSTLYLSTHAFA